MVTSVKSLQQICTLQFRKEIINRLHRIDYTNADEIDIISKGSFRAFTCHSDRIVDFSEFNLFFNLTLSDSALTKKTCESVCSAFQLIAELYSVTDHGFCVEPCLRSLNLELTSTIAVYASELGQLNDTQKQEYIENPDSRSNLINSQRSSIYTCYSLRSFFPWALDCYLHQEMMYFDLENLRDYATPINADRDLLAALFTIDENLFNKFKWLFRDSHIACTLAISANQLDYKSFENYCKNHRDVVVAGIEQDPSIFSSLSFTYRADFEITRLAVLRDGSLLKYADSRLKNDSRLIHLALMQNSDSVPWLVDWVKRTSPEDRALVLIAIQRDGSTLGHVKMSLRRDREIVFAAVNQYSANFRFACDELRDDYELVALAVRLNGTRLEWASPRLQREPSLIVSALGQGFSVSFFSATLKQNSQFMLEAVDQNASNFVFADIALRDDRQFVLTAIGKDPMLLQFASARLRRNREVVLSAFKKNLNALQLASNNLRFDKQFILQAINLSPAASKLAYSFADRKLRRDSEVLSAVRSHNIFFICLRRFFASAKFTWKVLSKALRLIASMLPEWLKNFGTQPGSLQP